MMPRKPLKPASSVRKSHLKFLGIAAPTRIRYFKAVREFFKWRKTNCVAPALGPEEVDEQLAEFVNSLFQRDRPLYIAGDALSGLKRFYPRLRRRLDLSGMYYKTWVKLIKRRKAIPLTKDLVRGMAVAGILYGRPDFAAAILVGFAGLLRTGEICSIQMKDVRIVRDDLMSISLDNSKGALRSGTSESVLLRDPALINIIRSLNFKFGDERNLFKGDYRAFRCMYSKAACFSGLHNDRATPHGIRRGGATWHFLFC